MLIALDGWKVIARPPQLRQTALLQAGMLEAEMAWPPGWGRPSAALLLPLRAEPADGDFFLARDGAVVRAPTAADVRAQPHRFSPLPDSPTRLVGLAWPSHAEWALPLLLFRSNTPLFHAHVRSKIDELLVSRTGWKDAGQFEADFAAQLGATDFEQALVMLAATALDDAEIAEAAAEYLRDHGPIASGLGPVRRP